MKHSKSHQALSFFFLLMGSFALGVAACGGDDDGVETCASGIACPAPMKCAARQKVCLETTCGDGVVDEGEECDDGNILDNDGCSAECKVERCGDGETQVQRVTYDDSGAVLKSEANEVCDWGKVGKENCAEDCTSNLKCGNGIVDPGEVCDHGLGSVGADGNWNSSSEGTLDCSQNCASTNECGNGILDNYSYLPEVAREECDPGNVEQGLGAIFPDGMPEAAKCLDSCVVQLCGDGKVTGDEQCDVEVIGGETSGCNYDCTLSICGDGKKNTQANEECDDGDPDDASQWEVDESTGQKTWKGSGSCTKQCTRNKCGDYYEGEGEECDDGPQGSGRCTTECKLNRCGDRYRGEIVRDGVTVKEECDDGEGGSYKCTVNCTRSYCGDGIVNGLAGETCDHGLGEGLAVGTAECNYDCTVIGCGDGIVNELAGEDCDPNTGTSSDPKIAQNDTLKCTKECKPSSCGDGYVNPMAQEACDPGSAGKDELGYWEGCNYDCTESKCGDGYVNALDGEECDPNTGATEDPRTAQGDAIRCTRKCKLSSCGDGYVNQRAQEACDPGPDGDWSQCETTTCAIIP